VRAQALAAGRVDATTMSVGTWLTIPDREGLHMVVPPGAFRSAAPVVSKVNVVSVEVLESRRAEVEAVVRALIRLSRDYAADPDAWARDMRPWSAGLDEAAMVELAASFAGGWSVNGGMGRAELAFTQDWLLQGEDFAGAGPVALDDWVD